MALLWPVRFTMHFILFCIIVQELSVCFVGGSSRGKAEKQEKHTKEDKSMEETPKRDARKRTRHSLQSPATDGIINKRQRRT